ncbi:hypothetical protein Y032_0098g3098 [Ancylostoma ceylanicum]|uniref:Uncharacterized protein n=1 Tax=Ancylostoma ceylanicum TaxID=53326 RepID=A0A016TIF0_9BILA|nr:hypothetical protein Y032_0098g3098 [Ancylostoma ceylanicum]
MAASSIRAADRCGGLVGADSLYLSMLQPQRLYESANHSAAAYLLSRSQPTWPPQCTVNKQVETSLYEEHWFSLHIDMFTRVNKC